MRLKNKQFHIVTPTVSPKTKNWWKLKIQLIFAGSGNMLGNGPHSFTQFMIRDFLITGRLGWVVCLSWPYWVR